MAKHRPFVRNGHKGGYGRDALRQKSNVPHYFVPSFSIRRHAEQTDELVDFLKKLGPVLGRSYHVYQPSQISMTLIEQAKLIQRLREAGECPEPRTMRNLSNAIGESLAGHLQGVDTVVRMPLGRIDRFGDEGNQHKLGVIPNGWKGYQARYARNNEADERMPLGLLVDEHRIAIGGIAAAFSRNRRFVIDGLARTPHIAFAVKTRGRITDSELRDVSGVVAEIMPEELGISDPAIYLRERRGQEEVLPMYVRLPEKPLHIVEAG